ncbi:MAG: hypothetical protein LDLANPLL_01920 [Turneriella sp.]|nr:hypothetical protein [Turneriella sp.]
MGVGVNIENSEPPWQNCIAVCFKCAQKIGAVDADKTQLRVALKSLVAERGLKERVRPVDSSCFDICPEERITVIHFTRNGVDATTVDSKTTPHEVLSRFGY